MSIEIFKDTQLEEIIYSTIHHLFTICISTTQMNPLRKSFSSFLHLLGYPRFLMELIAINILLSELGHKFSCLN